MHEGEEPKRGKIGKTSRKEPKRRTLRDGTSRKDPKRRRNQVGDPIGTLRDGTSRKEPKRRTNQVGLL